MLNILRMIQLLIRAIIIMILFKMMHLILVLIVSMMAWPRAKIGQNTPVVVEFEEFVEGDSAVEVVVHEFEDGGDDFVAFGVGDGVWIGGRGGIGVSVGGDAVSAQDFVVRPGMGVIKVVEGEEGGGVEVGDVVFFCGGGLVVSPFRDICE